MQESPSYRQPHRKAVTVLFSIKALILQQNTGRASGKSAFAWIEGVFTVLTDVALKNLRPQSKPYKSTDRDSLYVYVSPGGAISFRYDYRFNGRRETLSLGDTGAGTELRPGARAAVRDQAHHRRRRVPGDRKAKGETEAEGGLQFRACCEPLDGSRADGGQHAKHAAIDLQP